MSGYTTALAFSKSSRATALSLHGPQLITKLAGSMVPQVTHSKSLTYFFRFRPLRVQKYALADPDAIDAELAHAEIPRLEMPQRVAALRERRRLQEIVADEPAALAERDAIQAERDAARVEYEAADRKYTQTTERLDSRDIANNGKLQQIESARDKLRRGGSQEGAFASVFESWGASPHQVDVLRPVVDRNCVVARRGGEQRETNDQSAT